VREGVLRDGVVREGVVRDGVLRDGRLPPDDPPDPRERLGEVRLGRLKDPPRLRPPPRRASANSIPNSRLK
jgi:hypothetical protein